ncbi:hypothetical protein N0V95_009716 [Ascochyta clinopodiicola]|nr:hypothetical protein N0V95_009716 [Ascochyta clinopodiicola]
MTSRLKRHTLFVDDDSKDYEPLPPVSSNRGSFLSQRPDEATTDVGLIMDREVRAGQDTAQLGISIASGSLWNKYKLVHKRKLGGPVIAVLKLPAEKDDYLIRKLSIAEDEALAGISYLSSENLFHSLLNIDNVVISSDAVVRIAKLEYCEPDKHCSPKNAQAFGRTTMMLMDKFATEKGEIAVRQPHEWSKKATHF